LPERAGVAHEDGGTGEVRTDSQLEMHRDQRLDERDRLLRRLEREEIERRERVAFEYDTVKASLEAGSETNLPMWFPAFRWL
jgi:hypothetical protein